MSETDQRRLLADEIARAAIAGAHMPIGGDIGTTAEVFRWGIAHRMEWVKAVYFARGLLDARRP